MNTRILLFLLAVGCFLTACNSSGAPVPFKNVKVTPNAPDEQKFSYLIGTQIGSQSYGFPEAFLAEFYESLFGQGVRDAWKAEKDSAFKLQFPADTLRAVGTRYNQKAQKVQQEMAEKKMLPSLNKTAKSSKTKLSANASDDEKFSYMWGTDIGRQFATFTAELEPKFDLDIFLQGVHDVRISLKDTSKALQLSRDTLNAVGMRYQQKAAAVQEAAQQKFKEEQAKVKEEVAEMRGDTLPSGMPKLMNYFVKVTGITSEIQNLESFQGKPVFVFYFSTTCGHCQHAYPEVQKIADEFRSAGLTTLAIAAGSNTKKAILGFMEDQKAKDVTFVLDDSRQFGELYSDGYVPKAYLLRPNGEYYFYSSLEKDLDSIRTNIRTELGIK